MIPQATQFRYGFYGLLQGLLGGGELVGLALRQELLQIHLRGIARRCLLDAAGPCRLRRDRFFRIAGAVPVRRRTRQFDRDADRRLIVGPLALVGEGAPGHEAARAARVLRNAGRREVVGDANLLLLGGGLKQPQQQEEGAIIAVTKSA